MRFAVLIPAVALVAAPAPAQEPAGGAKVYQQAIPSVAWVHSTRTNGLATGSGSLVDRDKRLVLTNYHVVGENPKTTVFFPVYRDGQPIPERQYYSDRAKRLGTPGRVVAVDKTADLALIEVEKVPDDAKGIPLAAASPGPGDAVHSLGNAGKSGALWGYVRGTVRQVYHKKWQAQLEKGHVATFNAKVIETDSPTNPGDSGGPLLNDRGELVGVTQGGATNAQLVSFFVDLSEVKRVLAKRAAGGDAPTAGGARRDKPLTVTDNAKLFSSAAVKTADAAIADLFKQGADVLIETYPAAPKEWADKLKAADGSERKKVFGEWARERLKAEKARGVAVLVCLDPRFVIAQVPPEDGPKFASGFSGEVGDAVLKAFKKEKYDQGLADIVRLAKEDLKEAKK